VHERLNENRHPLHSVLREIQETDCGDLADLTPLVAVAGHLKFQGRAVDVILTHTTPPVLAAKQATSIIPIVFASAGDPVRMAEQPGHVLMDEEPAEAA
jgi:hypothetical protein